MRLIHEENSNKNLTITKHKKPQGMVSYIFIFILIFFSCNDSATSDNLQIGTEIADIPFAISSEGSSKEYAYTDTGYGNVSFTGDMSKVNFAITDMSDIALDGKVTVDENGVITVADGLGVGNYSFKVEVSAKDGEGYSGSKKTEELLLNIGAKALTDLELSASSEGSSKEYAYTDTSYGNVSFTGDMSKVNFAITDMSDIALDGKVTVDENGVITVADGLGVGNYSFKVEVSAKDGEGYSGSKKTEELLLNIGAKALTDLELSASSEGSSKEYAYTDTGYGNVSFTGDMSKVNFAITDMSDIALDGKVTVDENGVITVADGLGVGNYSFKVEVSAKDGEGYSGSKKTEELLLNIGAKALTDLELSASSEGSSKEYAYTDTSYGNVSFTGDMSKVNFAITDMSDIALDGKVTVDENGVITVADGLGVGNYSFKVEVSAKDGEGYSGSKKTEELLLNIGAKALTDLELSASSEGSSKEYAYTDTGYGNVSFTGDMSKVNFAITDMSDIALDGKVTVDENGVITVADGLGVGNYSFKVEVSAKDGEGYSGSKKTEELLLNIGAKALTDLELSASSEGSSKEYAYTDTGYGNVSFTGDMSKVNFAITDMSDIALDGKVTVDENGVITVADGLGVGNYSFKVEVSAKDGEGYSGSKKTEELSLNITLRPISFNTSIIVGNEYFLGYADFTLGAISLLNGSEGTFSIIEVSDNALNSKINVDNQSGNITVLEGLDVGKYNFKVRITGTGDYQGSVATTEEIAFDIKFIVNTDNVKDGIDPNNRIDYRLDGTTFSTTAVVDGKTFLLAVAKNDRNLIVFEVSDGGQLNYTHNAYNYLNKNYRFDLPTSITIRAIGEKTYVFVVGEGKSESNSGVSVFELSSEGRLTNVHNISDSNDIYLSGDSSATTAEVDGTTYLFVSGGVDDGISVFELGSDGNLDNNVDNVTDSENPRYKLNGASSVTTAEVDGTTYLFASAGSPDNGVSVFEVLTGGILKHVYDESNRDNSRTELNGASSVTTAEVGGNTYLFVAGELDNGVTVFKVNSNGSLSYTDAVDDRDQDNVGSSYNLNGASSVTTAEINGSTYLFVSALFDNGVSVFRVSNSGKLDNVENISDGGSLELRGANSVHTAVVGGKTFLFVTGFSDDGISVFQVGN